MNTSTTKLFIFFLLFLLCRSISIDRSWMNPQDTPAQRAHALLAKMTLQEKLSMVHGWGGPYVGNVAAIPRLNIPSLHLEDGPQGVADGVRQVTCWPSALTVVASWDRNLMNQYSAAMGKEQRIKGTNIMLGPMINIARVPMGGRNFESFGEDPYLASELVRQSVQGIQSQGVMACAKHYVDNNQEYHRTTVSENVDERTQYEVYYPAFKAAVEAGVGSIMCSYNKINNTWACENEVTLGALKKDLGFQGFVMSDWGATHTTVKAANAGLDMQMPDASFFGTPLQNAVASGQVSQTRVDDMVVRILTAMFQVGLFDNPQTGNLSVNAQSSQHTALARELAEAGTVLLKNEKNILPIDTKTVKQIAVIGQDGNDAPTYAGGGSGHVESSYVITPLQGLRASLFSTDVTVTYNNGVDVQSAAATARAASVAIVFVAVDSSEGSDRPNLSLPGNQDALVSAVAAAQPNTIVVAHTAGAILMPWANSVPGIIAALLPGQEDGNAIANILLGSVNPGGKLPVTFPVTQAQIPVNTPSQYPGINDQADYSEGLLVGYKWYDAKGVAPLFPFGHGLSYTTFQYSNLTISGNPNAGTASVSVTVKNTGTRYGSEVPQLYLGFPASAGEPPKQLRGFQKLYLMAGESKTVQFPLGPQDVSIYDVNRHGWANVPGVFNVYVGSSSADIRLTGTITNH